MVVAKRATRRTAQSTAQHTAKRGARKNVSKSAPVKREGGASLEWIKKVAATARTRGLAHRSLRSIARDIGVTPQALIYQFHSLDELLVAVIDYIGENDVVIVEEAMNRVQSLPELPAALLAATRSGAYLEAAPANMELLAIAANNPARYGNMAQRFQGRWRDAFQQALIRFGVERERAHRIAMFILASATGATLQTAIFSDEASVVMIWSEWLQQVQRLMDDLDRELRARPAASRARGARG